MLISVKVSISEYLHRAAIPGYLSFSASLVTLLRSFLHFTLSTTQPSHPLYLPTVITSYPHDTSASKSSIRRFVITEKAPTRAFSWLKAATTAFTFKTLLRHYAKRTLTPRSLNVKLGTQCKGHKGQVVW